LPLGKQGSCVSVAPRSIGVSAGPVAIDRAAEDPIRRLSPAVRPGRRAQCPCPCRCRDSCSYYWTMHVPVATRSTLRARRRWTAPGFVTWARDELMQVLMFFFWEMELMQVGRRPDVPGPTPADTGNETDATCYFRAAPWPSVVSTTCCIYKFLLRFYYTPSVTE
jgi:hypothetical protein